MLRPCTLHVVTVYYWTQIHMSL